MSNIELLKQELIMQKQAIESKGGTVVVGNLNPSPSEITAGINSIEAVNLTASNATESDVVLGKTFYSKSKTLKTGTLDIDGTINKYLNTFLNQEETDQDQKTIVLPSGIKTLKNYSFNLSTKSLSVRLNSDIEVIGEYAFNDAPNVRVENFSTLENLKTIGNYAFKGTAGSTVNTGEIPNSVETIGEYCFAQAYANGDSIRLPQNLIEIGKYAFANTTELVYLNKLEIPTNIPLTSFPTYIFNMICFNDDFTAPANVESINSYFNYRGSFHNVTIPATCTSLLNYCFYGSTTDPNDPYYMKTLVFESETPPSVGRYLIANQHFANGLKIYVPDNAVEEYKAVANFKTYGYDAYIYPMSQKL